MSTFAIDYSGILIHAAETISSQIVISVTKGRNLDTEESIGRWNLSGRTEDLLTDSE